MSTDRTEWLAWRRQGLGASDVAAVLGVSPWGSPWSVWADKVSPADDDEPNAAQEFGLLAEPIVKAYFERRTALTVTDEQSRHEHPDMPWLRCTLDGIVRDDHGDIVGLYEAKTTNEGKWETIPLHYQCQGQAQMAVTGAQRVWFAVLHFPFGRFDFQWYVLERDDADIATLLDACSTFWNDHVLTGVPPAADAHQATAPAITSWYDEPDLAGCVEADDDLAERIARINALKAATAAMSVEIAEHENTIRAALGDATTLTHGFDAKGRPVVVATWREQERHSTDTAALKAAHPELAAEFERTTTTRTLLVKKPKAA